MTKVMVTEFLRAMNAQMAAMLAAILMLFAAAPVCALMLPLTDDDLVGTVNSYLVRKDDSLIEVARTFGLGYNEITEANRDMDPFIPSSGEQIRLPLAWVLPAAPRIRGIIINLSEMRLFYFPSGDGKSVFTFPIGIGDEGTETPVGSFSVTEKRIAPAWKVPDSIRRDDPGLPRVVPPGPDNPLGSHALRLSGGPVLIHGTNKPWGVGRKASHGCIRLYPEDIPQLFQLVQLGERTVIVRQPVKIGLGNGRVFMEVHRGERIDYVKEALRLVMARGLLHRIDSAKFFRALREMSGTPEDITSN